MIAKLLRIRGRVQGVGFRLAVREQARVLGVTGWVRNRSDGSVETLVQGPRDAVEELITWSRSGPSGARVDEVSVGEEITDETYSDRFEFRAST